MQFFVTGSVPRLVLCEVEYFCDVGVSIAVVAVSDDGNSRENYLKCHIFKYVICHNVINNHNIIYMS